MKLRKMKMPKNSSKYTSIGGQALIEGIMMKSPKKTALAVRHSDGGIEICEVEEHSLRQKYKFFALPVIRGVVAFLESLITGYKTMTLSAEKSGYLDETDEDTGETKGVSKALMAGIMTAASVLAVGICVVLFFWLPSLAADGINKLTNGFFDNAKSVIEGIIKMIIFVTYVWAITLMKDVKRVFQYHGAEHKTIFCYEAHKPLTVENAREMKRFHPRCGTSFMVLMIIVSIVVSLIAENLIPGLRDLRWAWVIAKIFIITPIICGLGFEVLKICGKYDNVFTKIISAPGLWLQRLTTKEPDDSMLEIAIAAMNEVLDDGDPLKIIKEEPEETEEVTEETNEEEKTDTENDNI